MRNATLEDLRRMGDAERWPGGHQSGGQTLPPRPYCSECGAPCQHCATERRQREEASKLARLAASDADERVLGAHEYTAPERGQE